MIRNHHLTLLRICFPFLSRPLHRDPIWSADTTAGALILFRDRRMERRPRRTLAPHVEQQTLLGQYLDSHCLQTSV